MCAGRLPGGRLFSIIETLVAPCARETSYIIPPLALNVLVAPCARVDFCKWTCYPNWSKWLPVCAGRLPKPLQWSTLKTSEWPCAAPSLGGTAGGMQAERLPLAERKVLAKRPAVVGRLRRNPRHNGMPVRSVPDVRGCVPGLNSPGCRAWAFASFLLTRARDAFRWQPRKGKSCLTTHLTVICRLDSLPAPRWTGLAYVGNLRCGRPVFQRPRPGPCHQI